MLFKGSNLSQSYQTNIYTPRQGGPMSTLSFQSLMPRDGDIICHSQPVVF